MGSPSDRTVQYYEEVLRNLSELMVLLKHNNILLKELLVIQRADHSTNVNINDNLRKIKFNTQ